VIFGPQQWHIRLRGETGSPTSASRFYLLQPTSLSPFNFPWPTFSLYSSLATHPSATTSESFLRLIKGQMERCSVCQVLQTRAYRPRLAFDFEPSQLVNSATQGGCRICAGILSILLSSESKPNDTQNEPGPSPTSLIDKISRIYIYGQSTKRSTLSLEIYMSNDDPKRCLELFYANGDGGSDSPLPPCWPSW